ncbi:MAG: AAA family ATPase [Chloroflexota bacterium]
MYARPMLCPTLIGRREEMRIIEQAVEAARSGRGGSIVLLGEAGVGKSRLARDAAADAEHKRMRVLWGRCVEGGQAAPYRPFAEALLTGLRGHAPPDVPELRPFKPILGRLIPDWRGEAGAAADQSVVLLGEAILRLLLVLAGDHGCLLIIEDLHWADPETLSVVEYLSANLAAEALLVFSTLRSGEPTPGLALASSLRARRVGQFLELQRLDVAETSMMAEACLDTPDLPQSVRAALASSAEGLPLLVEDLLAEWVAAGQLAPVGDEWQAREDLAQVVPVTFAETVRRRLSLLGAEATAVLRLAALIGRSFDWCVLPGAAGLDDEQVLDELQRAIHAQLISVETVQGRAAIRFRHALTQAGVLAGLLPPQRAKLAASLLDLIEKAYPGLPDDWCELAARLAEEAGNRSRAAALLLESGRRALAGGALTTVEATLNRARALCEQGSALALDVEETLIDALGLAGKHEQAASIGAKLTEALARLDAPPDRLGQAHLRIARAYVAASNWTAASRHLDLARQLGPASEAPLMPSVDALAAHVAIGHGRLDDARELARSAWKGAERVGLWEVACEALEVIGRAARDRDLEEAEAAFEQARRIAEHHGLSIWRLRAVHELGTIDMFTPGAGSERLLQARELAEKAGALGVAAMVDVQLAAVETALGNFDSVLALTSRSADMAQRLGLSLTRAVALMFKAEAYARRGPDRPAMEATLSAALEVAAGDPLFAAEAQGAAWGDCRATASLAEENRQRALSELEKAQEFFRGARGTAPSPSRGLWALLKTLAGDEGPAACREVMASSAMMHLINQGYLRYAEAILAGREGRSSDAVLAMAAGDALLAISAPWCLHLGRRLAAEEAIARGWGDPARWLWEAAAFFEEHGQQRVTSACKSLLRKCGVPAARPGRAHSTVPPAFRTHRVTDREMEVLSIIGEGLSNREIGARLYLSPKTVEKHISSLMDKLEVRSRAQLAAIAAAGTVPI